MSSGTTDAGTDLGGTSIYTDGSGSRSVVFTCKYASSATASSEAYDVNTPADVTGSVTEATGTFADGLSIKYYTDNTYTKELSDPADIGSTLYAMVTWEVTTAKIGFFIQKCDVIDVSKPNDPTDVPTDERVSIIDGTCYAGVVNAAIYPDRAAIFTHKEAKFSYTSFSFNTNASDKQKILCTIQFCTMQDDGTTPVCHVDNASYTGSKPATDKDRDCPTTAAYLYRL